MENSKTEETSPFEYIETPESLKKLIREVKSLKSIALDTEADSFHHYQAKVCLIQLSFEDKTYIVDPLAQIDILSLLDALANKEILIHDAGYDLRLLNADFGFRPKNGVFDTKLAAALAGMEKVGLSDVLHHVTGLQVKKHNQRANWSQRPLPLHLLKYAAEDTASLMQIKDHLTERLVQLGRIDWHTESCQAAVEAAYAPKEPTEKDNEWRIKGAGTLSSKEMTFLREIWYWREKIAQKTNIAPFMICRNEDMIQLAEWAAKKKKNIEPDKKLPVRVRSRHLDTLITALQTAHAVQPDQRPGPRKSDPSKRLSETTRKAVDKLKSECEKIAHVHNLPLNLIASRSALTRIVVGEVNTIDEIRRKKILLNWQTDLILPAVQKVLERPSV